jgi:cytochrome c nitrite reductase small subunit
VTTVLVGMVIGVGVFGVGYSELPSYFSSDPRNCTNCHVMQTQYDDWSHGPHKNVATCDDCHLPHDSVVDKYRVQAEDGMIHGYKFTTGDYPNTIVIRASSLQVVNQACLYCHGTMTSTIHVGLRAGETITCTHCHENVGHDD